VRKKDSSIGGTGKVVWHSLDKDGSIKVYDVRWPSVGLTERNIPADTLEGVKETNHKNEEEHGVQSENTPIKERKKKRKKKNKALYWYFGHHDDDEYDHESDSLEFGGFDGGDGGGGE